MYRSYKRAQIKSQNAEYEYTQLQKRNADLESSIALLQTEQGKELELRKRFDVGYEGEKLLVFVDPKKEEEKTLTPVPWWRRMLWYFSF